MKKLNRKRAIRNLVITLLLLTIIWYLNDCPLPTMEMEMRRDERQALMEESRIIWRYDAVTYGDPDMLLGVSTDYISAHAEGENYTFFAPRTVDTPTLILLPARTRYLVRGSSYLAPTFLAVDAPSRTQSARLTMSLDAADWDEVYVMEGQQDGAVWLFQLRSKYRPLDGGHTDGMLTLQNREEQALSILTLGRVYPEDLRHCIYTLEFFDAEGDLIETLSNPAQQS